MESAWAKLTLKLMHCGDLMSNLQVTPRWIFMTASFQRLILWLVSKSCALIVPGIINFSQNEIKRIQDRLCNECTDSTENVSSITFSGSVINCLVNEGHREEIFFKWTTLWFDIKCHICIFIILFTTKDFLIINEFYDAAYAL